ncbi:MAG TPA: galactokinase [Chitinophagaceae bacterium]|nr:galactokinase [Chitinophagaceae bacterium]
MQTFPLAHIVKDRYTALYNSNPGVVRSPGRVNIIGEHTDYNEGFVLPAAIDKASYVAVGRRTDNNIQLYAEEFGETYESSLTSLAPSDRGWPNYILGVVDQLVKSGYKLQGFNLVLTGDVPIGAGLSSSASIECATGFALSELFHLAIPKLELVKMAQRAEHLFAGVRVGIMDMFASVFGKRDHVIQLDCRSLDFKYVPFKMDGIKIVLFNTNIEHSLASSEYNTRRQQCEAGVALIKQYHPEVHSLRDATMDMLHQYVEPKDKLIYKRCKYVVEEKERLLQGCEDLARGDIKALGQKMFQTHDGLSHEYEVSCKELDFLVDQVRNNEAVLGARMMGGGFGGCTINLVKEEAIDSLVKETTAAYTQHMNRELLTYIAQIEDGTSVVPV